MSEITRNRKAEMVDVKIQIQRDSRRHSKKLIKKLNQVFELSEIAEDRIHQEVLYASLDAYRTTMKLTRNGDMKNAQNEARHTDTQS